MDVAKEYVQLFLEKGPVIVDTVAPYLEQLFKHLKVLYTFASKYTNYVEGLLGILFLFWGGNFVLLVAAMEAFKVVGYRRLKENLQDLYKSFVIAREAYAKDVTQETAILEFATKQMGKPTNLSLDPRRPDPRDSGRGRGRGGKGIDWEGRRLAAESGKAYNNAPSTPTSTSGASSLRARGASATAGVSTPATTSSASGASAPTASAASASGASTPATASSASGAAAATASTATTPESVHASESVTPEKATTTEPIETKTSTQPIDATERSDKESEAKSTAESASTEAKTESTATGTISPPENSDISGEASAGNEPTTTAPEAPSKDQLSAVARLANVARAVDPNLVSKSFGSLCAGILAVVATLQSNMARVLALGASMGDLVLRPVQATAHEVLLGVLPEDYHKWIGIGLSYFVKLLGIMVAFFFQRWILITNLCMQSSKWIISATIKLKIVPKWVEDKLTLLSLPLAVLGIAKQVIWGYELPLLLWLVLLPALVLEWFCTFFVISSVAAPGAIPLI